ncbi:MAG: bifunctional riboflavin kinase/FAD synthetase [Actinomycetota bacterium]|nr:bifunctional riboflavin kinase/FAD synthetase [Actinomycetota bacterium]
MSITPAPSAAATGGTVACIGVFDGVHLGHRALMARARREADSLGLPLVAVTFDPHPMTVVSEQGAPTSLASVAHRSALLLQAGADEVDVLPFDAAMAATDAADFVRFLLVDRLGVRAVVVGEDFRFGHQARGSVATLADLGERWGFVAIPVPLAGHGEERWSSTLARRLVVEGDLRAAAAVLGRDYRLDGIVVHGDHRGRDLGFPTANLAWPGDPTIPADGVYAGWLIDGNDRMAAAISVGTNPQFGGSERRVEAYAIGRGDLDLYGHEASIEFVERIRGQLTFPGVDALIEQMSSDVSAASTILRDHG